MRKLTPEREAEIRAAMGDDHYMRDALAELDRLRASSADGAGRIAAERQRQIEVEGYDANHDDESGDCLAWAAVCYAAPERVYRRDDYASAVMFNDAWPGWRGDKRPHNGNVLRVRRDGARYPVDVTPEQRIRLLEMAGALIAAEIDRLLRKAGP